MDKFKYFNDLKLEKKGDKMKRKTIVLISTLSVVIISFSAILSVFIVQPKYDFPLALTSIEPQDMGTKERIEDFKFFYNVIKENYPYLVLKQRTHGFNWLDLKEYFIDKIKQADSNEEFLEIISEAITALQNLHCTIIPYELFDYYAQIYSKYNMGAYVEVFTNEQVADAQFYWYQIMKKLPQKQDYDAKMVYSQGNYTIVEGYSFNWKEKYNITNGSIVIAVNGTPIDNAIKESYRKTYLRFDPFREKLYVRIITPELFGENAVFTVKNATNDAMVNVSFSTFPKIWSYSSAKSNYVTKLSEDCGYVYLSSFSSMYIDSDKTMLFNFYKQIENCSKLIFDIRDNYGGSTRYWYENIIEPLAKTTLKYEYYLAFRDGDYVNYFRENRSITLNMPKEDVTVSLPPEVYTEDFTDLYWEEETIEPQHQFNFDGKIYLLTSDSVYSAAESFAYACKQTHFAELYGTYTGGDGIGIDPIVFVLPNSKLVIRIPQVMGIKANGEADEETFVLPDYKFESEYGDYNALIELILQETN